MLHDLSILDLVVFIVIIILLNFKSIWAGLKRNKTENDFFMAGHTLRWWSVAGSIYGTNVNATQVIGMLGIGYSIGFAQSNFEVLPIIPIIALAYIFVPIYRRRKIFTLSQFLGHHYNHYSQLVYSVLNIFFILIQVVAGFYIGSRTLGLLFHGSILELSYFQGILILAVVTALFSVFGGMESVVIADNIQTVLLILASVTVGTLTFMQPEIHGFTGLLKIDHEQALTAQKMHLYLPSNHKDLPWTGAWTGLMILNFFYWTTNQYQVQRVLAAATDRDAKIGTLVSGFLKLIIPFFSIAGGVAAYYLFKARLHTIGIKPDDAFLKLMAVVVPKGYGIIGLILAALTSAIFGSISSMLNSFTTLVSIDIYQKYYNSRANDRQVVVFGKIAIAVMVILAAALALYGYDPQSSDNFALKVSAQLSYLKPGIVVAFFLGIFWRKANGRAAVIGMLAAPFFGVFAEQVYSYAAPHFPFMVHLFGPKLNFMHRTFITTVFCTILQVGLTNLWSAQTIRTEGFHIKAMLPGIYKNTLWFIAVQTVIIGLVQFGLLSLNIAAFAAALITFWIFVKNIKHNWFKSDMLLAGVLSALTVWILYAFA